MQTEPRRSRGRLGRIVYLATLAAIVVLVANVLLGHLVFFRAQGLVVADTAELASEFTATIERVAVSRGARVERGQLVAEVRSFAVRERTARIAADIAEVEAVLLEAVARRSSEQRLLGAARARLETIAAIRERFRSADGAGLVTGRDAIDVENDYFHALAEVENLTSSIEGLEARIRATRTRLGAAEEALRTLRSVLDEGALRAPFAGVVVELPAVEGTVITPGQAVARIAATERYVLAYQPTGTLYETRVGEAVSIQTGVDAFDGRISARLPLTVQLPEEFQRAFSPAAREQVLRVDFVARGAPPLFAKVELRRPGLPLIAALRRWLTGAGEDDAAR